MCAVWLAGLYVPWRAGPDFASVFQNSGVAQAVLRPDGVFVDCNRALLALTGYVSWRAVWNGCSGTGFAISLFLCSSWGRHCVLHPRGALAGTLGVNY